MWPDGPAPAALANLLFDPPKPQRIEKKRSVSRLCYLFAHLYLLFFSLFLFSLLFLLLVWLFPPLLFHLSILSEVWLLNFLRIWVSAAAGKPVLFCGKRSRLNLDSHKRCTDISTSRRQRRTNMVMTGGWFMALFYPHYMYSIGNPIIKLQDLGVVHGNRMDRHGAAPLQPQSGHAADRCHAFVARIWRAPRFHFSLIYFSWN